MSEDDYIVIEIDADLADVKRSRTESGTRRAPIGGTFSTDEVLVARPRDVPLDRYVSIASVASHKEAADARRDPRKLVARSIPVTVIQPLSAEEAAARFPFIVKDSLEGAAFIPGDGYIDPYSLTMAYARGARMNGAKIEEGVTVEENDEVRDVTVGDLGLSGYTTDIAFVFDTSSSSDPNSLLSVARNAVEDLLPDLPEGTQASVITAGGGCFARSTSKILRAVFSTMSAVIPGGGAGCLAFSTSNTLRAVFSTISSVMTGGGGCLAFSASKTLRALIGALA